MPFARDENGIDVLLPCSATARHEAASSSQGRRHSSKAARLGYGLFYPPEPWFMRTLR